MDDNLDCPGFSTSYNCTVVVSRPPRNVWALTEKQPTDKSFHLVTSSNVVLPSYKGWYYNNLNIRNSLNTRMGKTSLHRKHLSGQEEFRYGDRKKYAIHIRLHKRLRNDVWKHK